MSGSLWTQYRVHSADLIGTKVIRVEDDRSCPTVGIVVATMPDEERVLVRWLDWRAMGAAVTTTESLDELRPRRPLAHGKKLDEAASLVGNGPVGRLRNPPPHVSSTKSSRPGCYYPSGLQIQEALDAYLECALWASADDDGEPIDVTYSVTDIAPESILAAETDVSNFMHLLADEGIAWGDKMSPAQLGHDLWLTRNHHGAGFWDRGLGELGGKLTHWAHTFGESNAYVGDDGRIYLS